RGVLCGQRSGGAAQPVRGRRGHHRLAGRLALDLQQPPVVRRRAHRALPARRRVLGDAEPHAHHQRDRLHDGDLRGRHPGRPHPQRRPLAGRPRPDPVRRHRRRRPRPRRRRRYQRPGRRRYAEHVHRRDLAGPRRGHGRPGAHGRAGPGRRRPGGRPGQHQRLRPAVVVRRDRDRRRPAARRPGHHLAGASAPEAGGPMRARRSTAALLAAVALAAGVAGCAADPGDQSADGTDCGPVTVEDIPADVTPLPDPPAPKLPVTVDSADGTRVTVSDASRILPVNLYGSIAEIVFALGLGERVVGRDTATTFPAAAHLPLVTPAGHDLSAEGVLALDPTVILVDATVGPAEALEQLRRSGIPVVFIDDTQTLEAVPEHIRQVAAALGVPEAGEELVARVTDEIESARREAPAGTEAPRVAFLYLRGGAGVYLMAGDG